MVIINPTPNRNPSVPNAKKGSQFPVSKLGWKTNNIRYPKPTKMVNTNSQNWIVALRSTFLQVNTNMPIAIKQEMMAMVSSVRSGIHMICMIVASELSI